MNRDQIAIIDALFALIENPDNSELKAFANRFQHKREHQKPSQAFDAAPKQSRDEIANELIETQLRAFDQMTPQQQAEYRTTLKQAQRDFQEWQVRELAAADIADSNNKSKLAAHNAQNAYDAAYRLRNNIFTDGLGRRIDGSHIKYKKWN